jgi:hypothetical protein
MTLLSGCGALRPDLQTPGGAIVLGDGGGIAGQLLR